MSIKVSWLGHSAFEIECEGKTYLIDPFLTDNPRASCSADSLNPEAILLTHAHADHLGDTVSIAKRTNALVIANFEICEWLTQQGVQNTHGMNLGGRYLFDFGTVVMTMAHHSSQLPDGSYGGNPGGILLKMKGVKIYHAGDTSLFLDMSLIGEEEIDLAILPIGDNYTMGPAASLRAIELLSPKQVIPCHYNTWPIIQQDAYAWAQSVKQQAIASPVVLTSGESIVLETDS